MKAVKNPLMKKILADPKLEAEFNKLVRSNVPYPSIIIDDVEYHIGFILRGWTSSEQLS